MSSKHDVKDVAEVVDLAVAVVNIGVDSMADGKIGVTDLAHLSKLIPVVIPAFDGIKNVPMQLEDMDQAEGAELVARVMTSLAVGDEKARRVINASLKLVANSAVDVVELIAAVKALKAPEAPVAPVA